MMRAVHSCCLITAECTSIGPSYLDQKKKKRKDLVAIGKCMRYWALPVRVEGRVCVKQKAAASESLTCYCARLRPGPFSSGGAVAAFGIGDWRRKYEDMTSGGIQKESELANENGCYLHHKPLPSRTKLTLGFLSNITKGRPPEEEAAAGNIVELMQAQDPTRTAVHGEDVNDRKDHEPQRRHLRRSGSGFGAVAVAAAATVTGDICAGESGLTSAENHNGELESSRSSNNNTDGSSILLESAAESVISRSSISNNSELQSAVPGFQSWLRMHEEPPLLLQHQHAIYPTVNGAGGTAGEKGDPSVEWSTDHRNGGFVPVNDSSGQGIMSMRVEDMKNDMASGGLAGAGPGRLLGGRLSSNELVFRPLEAHNRERPFSMQSASTVPSDPLWPRGSNASSKESWLKLGVGPSMDSSSSAAAAAGLSFHPPSSHHAAPSNGDPHNHDRPWSGQPQGHHHAHERNHVQQNRPSTSSTTMGISFPITGGNSSFQSEFLPTDATTIKSSQAIMPAAEQCHHGHRSDSYTIPSEYGRSTPSSSGVHSVPSTTNFSPATFRRVPVTDADAPLSISSRDHAGASGSSSVHFPTFSTNVVNVGQSKLFAGGGGISMNAASPVGTGTGGAAIAADAHDHDQHAFGLGRSTSGGSASVIRTSSMRLDSGKDAPLASLSQRGVDAVDEERFYDTRSQIPAVFPPARNPQFPNGSSSSINPGPYVSYSNRDGPALPTAISSTAAAATGTYGGVHGQFNRAEQGYGSSSTGVGRSTDVNNNNLHCQLQADGQPFSLASLMHTRDGDLRGETTGSGVAPGYPWHPGPAFEARGGQVPSSGLIQLGKNFQGWTSNANTSVPITNAGPAATGSAAAFNARSHVRADDGPLGIPIDSPQQAIRASDQSWGDYFRKVNPNIVFQSSTGVTGHDREPHAHVQLHRPPGEDTEFQSTSFSHHPDRDDSSLAAFPASREGGGDPETFGVLKRAIKHFQSTPAWPPAETLNLTPVAWPSSSSGNGFRGNTKLENSFDASSSEPPLISPFLSEPSFTARGDRVSLRATPPRRQTWQQQQQQQLKHTKHPYYSSSANGSHKQSPLTPEKTKLRLLSSRERDSRGSCHAPGLWFVLQSAESQNEEGGLPQVSKAYLRIKDGKMQISAVKKYLVTKLGLTSESEIEITCKGQPVVSSLSLQHVRDVIWFSKLAANGKAAQNLASSHSSGDHDHGYDQDRDEEFRDSMLPAAGAHTDHDSERQHQPDDHGADSVSPASAATIISNDILMVLTYRRHSRERTLPLTTFLT